MNASEIKDTIEDIEAIELSLKSWMPSKWRKEQLAHLKILKSELAQLQSN